jgi:hypothetical protein
MHTSFLSSICPLDVVGVTLAFDILVKLVALIDNEELCSELISGDSFVSLGRLSDEI